jgi:hypothetical protein
MQFLNRFSKLAASSLLLVSAFAAGNATARPGTMDFTATFNTTEFLLPAENCPSGVGGIGVGAGTTNLFTKKPASDQTTVVLASFDCVTPSVNGATFIFGPGKFTLTGPGGDTIFATYSGTLYLEGPDPLTGLPVYKFGTDAMFNIQGGTGRYSKAVGSGSIGGTETINQASGTAQGKLTAVGKIVY